MKTEGSEKQRILLVDEPVFAFPFVLKVLLCSPG